MMQNYAVPGAGTAWRHHVLPVWPGPEGYWQVKLEGDQMTWVKDGKDDGTGTIVKGNPSNSWSVMLPTAELRSSMPTYPAQRHEKGDQLFRRRSCHGAVSHLALCPYPRNRGVV